MVIFYGFSTLSIYNNCFDCFSGDCDFCVCEGRELWRNKQNNFVGISIIVFSSSRYNQTEWEKRKRGNSNSLREWRKFSARDRQSTEWTQSICFLFHRVDFWIDRRPHEHQRPSVQPTAFVPCTTFCVVRQSAFAATAYQAPKRSRHNKRHIQPTQYFGLSSITIKRQNQTFVKPIH